MTELTVSRIVDYDDWGILFDKLQLTEARYGSLEVDWFASEYRFYSRLGNIHHQKLMHFGEQIMVCVCLPPVHVVLRLLRKINSDQAVGVLVAPCWKSATFWPVLCYNVNFISSVTNWFHLPTRKSYYVPRLNGKSMFGNVDLAFQMLALKMDFQ